MKRYWNKKNSKGCVLGSLPRGKGSIGRLRKQMMWRDEHQVGHFDNF